MLIKKLIFLFVLPISGCLFGGTILKPSITSELIIQQPYPSNMLDNHAATIVELGSVELLAAWYAGIKEGDKSTISESALTCKK